jgi:hypothetical protein
MPKVILGLGISIDGYVARLNGAVDFVYAQGLFDGPVFCHDRHGDDGTEDL